MNVAIKFNGKEIDTLEEVFGVSYKKGKFEVDVPNCVYWGTNVYELVSDHRTPNWLEVYEDECGVVTLAIDVEYYSRIEVVMY